MITQRLAAPLSNPTEVECVKILANRYGDGTIYLPEGTSQALFYACIEQGLISDDGFLTRKGRQLLLRYPDKRWIANNTLPP
ncbi:MAG: hypothetical protein ACREYE_22170 [Gammaproteobacteria bacterium]